ncbi:MAG TPA: NAD(P)-dependent oxidoreductase [Gaiellaceae bacterium]|nr:NAD(P)-dependent oxidoreductase [Gaiellaceae bacterium]
MRVFVAGGSGAIGRRLVPQLVARGHEVFASTTRAEKIPALRTLGAEALVMDGLDEASVGEAVARAEPEVIVHQMTALAGVGDLKHFDEVFALTNELRTKGTDNLLAAGEAAGVRRFVAQSYTGWPNAREGGPVKAEADPLDPAPPKNQSRTLEAIRRLELTVLNAPLEGIVLRYGSLYGPGASDELVELVRRRKLPIVGDGRGVWSWVHVDDAASATVAAIERGRRGKLNIVDDEPAPVAEWLPYLARALGAKPPRRVPAGLARLVVGEVGVSMMTRIRGSSNEKAKRELGWTPRWIWREGFRHGLSEPDAPAEPVDESLQGLSLGHASSGRA